MRTKSVVPDDVLKQEDAIEKYFCIPFSKLKMYPMDTEISEIAIRLTLVGENFSLPEEELPFLVKLIKKRISLQMDFEINSDRLLIYIAMLTNNPGNAVMFINYLQYWSKQNNTKVITWDDFNMKIFPFGYPNEEDLLSLWDSIKVKPDKGTDNLLDYSLPMTSIRF